MNVSDEIAGVIERIVAKYPDATQDMQLLIIASGRAAQLKLTGKPPEEYEINEVMSPQYWMYHTDPVDLMSIENRYPWRGNVDIIPRYMPPHPRSTTQPEVRIAWKQHRHDGASEPAYLRHSHGPAQGFFWDVYGDNFLNIGVAILAIIQAPPPPANGGDAFVQKFTLPLSMKDQYR